MAKATEWIKRLSAALLLVCAGQFALAPIHVHIHFVEKALKIAASSASRDAEGGIRLPASVGEPDHCPLCDGQLTSSNEVSFFVSQEPFIAIERMSRVPDSFGRPWLIPLVQSPRGPPALT